MPIPTSRQGERVPLVTSPTGSPPASTGQPARGMPGSGERRTGRASRPFPARLCSRSRSAPTKSLSSAQAQPSPASIGVRSGRQVVAVERVADLEPQRVARAEAGRRRAGADQRLPDGRRVLGREQQLDAVLARVAGAADERLAPATIALGEAEARRGRSPLLQQRLEHRESPAGPAAPASRSRPSDRSTSTPSPARRPARRTRRSRSSALEALTTVRKRCSSRRANQ